MSETARTWSEWRILRWFLFLGLCTLLFGPAYLFAMRPVNATNDFVQEWLSARNFAEGQPVYGDLRNSAQRHLNISAEMSAKMLPYNAHPPVSVLLALPLGSFAFHDAVMIWNLIGLALYAATLTLLIRGFAIPFHPAAMLPILALSLACFPLYSQFAQGQFNLLLAFLIVLAWHLDVREKYALAGFAIGVAAAVKLFPAFLFVYFLVQRRWWALLVGGSTILLLNLLAVGILGIGELQSYYSVVVPSVTGYVSSRQNASLAGFWHRLFDANPQENVTSVLTSPILAQVLTTLSRILVVGALALTAWRATTADDRHRTWAMFITGMLLVSPITWPHYFVMLLLPFAFAWRCATGRLRRIAFWVLFVVMMLPVYYFPSLVMGKDRGGGDQYVLGSSVVSVKENLLAASVPAYALLGLFILIISCTNSGASRHREIAGSSK